MARIRRTDLSGQGPTRRRDGRGCCYFDAAGNHGPDPAVARAASLDPRVIGLYEQGTTIAPALVQLGEEAAYGEHAAQGPIAEAVLKLLRNA